MIEKNRNLLIRILSSAVLLPLILYLVARGGYWAGGLMSVSSALVASEYYLITQKRLSPAAWVGMAVAFALPLYPVWRPERAGDLCFWSLAAFLLFVWSYHLIRGPLPEAPVRSAHLVTGALYGSIGLTALTAVRNGENGLKWLVCALVITWGNDTCAYFAGRLLGRHKLYAQVSPNKTWEGFVGGMVGALAGMLIYRSYWFPALTLRDCAVLGVVGSILGPIGDLSESMLKRAYGVKDSGRIIPGHGGMLDRIDALLFNAPAVFLYAQWVRGYPF